MPCAEGGRESLIARPLSELLGPLAPKPPLSEREWRPPGMALDERVNELSRGRDDIDRLERLCVSAGERAGTVDDGAGQC